MFKHNNYKGPLTNSRADNRSGNQKEPLDGIASVNKNSTPALPSLLLEEGDINENIIKVFPDLPEQEQQWVMDRSESLMDKLVKLRSKKQLLPTSPIDLLNEEMDMNCDFSTTSLPTQVVAARDVEKLEVLPTPPHDHELAIEEDGHWDPPSKKKRNGSVFLDKDKALDQITVVD
ncbi:UNVERIFIED_CONTAM: hypothetical protein K2H54_001048 [Gekko kuhli]